MDFATDLSHMRHTHKYKIILVHNQSSSAVKQALAITAHETYKFEDIVANAPEKEQVRVSKAWAQESVLAKLLSSVHQSMFNNNGFPHITSH